MRITVIAVLAVVAVLIAGVLGLSIAASRVDGIYNGVTVDGVELTGMSIEEAAVAIEIGRAHV